MNVEEEFNRKKVEAEVVLEDEEKTEKLVNDAEKKFASDSSRFSKGNLKQLLEYIPLFISLVKSYARKEYRNIPLSTIVAVVAMLLYFVGGLLMMRYDSSITVGDITVLVTLLGRMYMPVNSLLNIQVDWMRSMAMFSRIFE